MQLLLAARANKDVFVFLISFSTVIIVICIVWVSVDRCSVSVLNEGGFESVSILSPLVLWWHLVCAIWSGARVSRIQALGWLG